MTVLVMNDISQGVILHLGKSGYRDSLMACVQVQLIAFKNLSLSKPPAHLLPQHSNECHNLVSYGVDNLSLDNLMLLMSTVFSITRVNKIVVPEHPSSPCS